MCVFEAAYMFVCLHLRPCAACVRARVWCVRVCAFAYVRVLTVKSKKVVKISIEYSFTVVHSI